MTTFVRTTECSTGSVGFINMDHVRLLIPIDDTSTGTHITYADGKTHVYVNESVDEIISGRLPRIPQYGGPPTPSQLIHWTNQLAEKVKECQSHSVRQNETKILLNLEMVRRLLET